MDGRRNEIRSCLELHGFEVGEHQWESSHRQRSHLHAVAAEKAVAGLICGKSVQSKMSKRTELVPIADQSGIVPHLWDEHLCLQLTAGEKSAAPVMAPKQRGPFEFELDHFTVPKE